METSHGRYERWASQLPAGIVLAVAFSVPPFQPAGRHRPTTACSARPPRLRTLTRGMVVSTTMHCSRRLSASRAVTLSSSAPVVLQLLAATEVTSWETTGFAAVSVERGSMEDSNLRGLVDEEIVMKTGKVAGIGLAAGSVLGAVVSMMYDGPQVGSNVKYPQLIRTGKVCGPYAASFAVLGATYVGVEQTLEKYRMKKDIINGAAAGFAAGAVMGFAAGAVRGFRAGGVQRAFLSGSAIALTSVLLDVTGMRTTDEEEKGHH